MRKGKKQQKAHVIVRNLKLLREELARYRVDYVARTIVDKIDKCIYDEYSIIRNEDNEDIS